MDVRKITLYTSILMTTQLLQHRRRIVDETESARQLKLFEVGRQQVFGCGSVELRWVVLSGGESVMSMQTFRESHF